MCFVLFWQVLKDGKQNRAIATTDMNEHSSRSHALLCVTVTGVNKTTNTKTTGKDNTNLIKIRCLLYL